MEKELNTFKLNGRKDIFERRLREGYSEVAFGNGKWVENQRLVIVWVFYHPDGRIATYEPLRLKRINGFTIPSAENETEHREQGFRLYMEKYKIKVGAKTSLEDFFVKWELEDST